MFYHHTQMAVGKGKHNRQVEILPLTANSAAIPNLIIHLLSLPQAINMFVLMRVCLFISLHRLEPPLEPGFVTQCLELLMPLHRPRLSLRSHHDPGGDV